MQIPQCQCVISKQTFDCPVTLSFAKNIRAMEPNGRKRSWRSVSLVSSDKFVTRIVAASSAKQFTQVKLSLCSFYELSTLVKFYYCKLKCVIQQGKVIPQSDGQQEW